MSQSLFQEYLWFKENASAELADNQKRFWDAEQWGWYILLKYAAWHNNPKAKLPNKPEYLQKLAKANPKAANFANRWAEVMACFKVDGDWIVHPELIVQVKEKSSESKSKSVNARIGSIRRKLKTLPGDDPARGDLIAELKKLYDRTKLTEMPAEYQTPAQPELPAAAPAVATAESRKAASRKPAVIGAKPDGTVENGQIWHQGKKYFAGELEKKQKTVEAAYKAALKEFRARRRNFSNPAKWTEHTESLANLAGELNAVNRSLGLPEVSPPDLSAPAPAPRPAPPSPFVSLTDADLARMPYDQLERELQEAHTIVLNIESPPDIGRGMYYGRDGKLKPEFQDKLSRWRKKQKLLAAEIERRIRLEPNPVPG